MYLLSDLSITSIYEFFCSYNKNPRWLALIWKCVEISTDWALFLLICFLCADSGYYLTPSLSITDGLVVDYLLGDRNLEGLALILERFPKICYSFYIYQKITISYYQ